MSMASKNASGNIVEFKRYGPKLFKMSGQTYHLTPSAVFPDSRNEPKCSRIFVFDKGNELKNRLHQEKGNGVVNVETSTLIQEGRLKTVSPLVRYCKSGADIFTANPSKDLRMAFKAKSSQGAKKHHLNPAVSEVVIVVPGEQMDPRDIVLYRTIADVPNQRETMGIHELHPMIQLPIP